MEFNDYQEWAKTTARYPNIGRNATYPLLGLGGETGEVMEKFKKLIRDHNNILTDDYKKAIAAELSDVTWYLAMLAFELGYTLEEIIQINIEKLESRKARGVLKGSGDNR